MNNKIDYTYKNMMKKNLCPVNNLGLTKEQVQNVLPYLTLITMALSLLFMTGVIKRKA